MQGIYTAIVTAFKEDGSVDEAGTRAVIRHSITHCGADGIFVGGTMGERFKMTTKEVKDLLGIAADEASGRLTWLRILQRWQMRRFWNLRRKPAGWGIRQQLWSPRYFTDILRRRL